MTNRGLKGLCECSYSANKWMHVGCINKRGMLGGTKW